MLRAALCAWRIAGIAYIQRQSKFRAYMRALLVGALHTKLVVARKPTVSGSYVQDLALCAPQTAPIRVWHNAEHTAGQVGLAG